MNTLTRQLLLALLALAGGVGGAAGAAAADSAPGSSPFTGSSAAPPVVTARLMLSVGIPEGFEAFHEPQKTLVDVYYGGRLIGTTAARYTLDEIEFLQPDEIVSRIPNAISRTALLQHLTGAVPRNSDLLCPPGQTVACGKLEPDFIGVIFNETRFRADLFVHPDMLFVQAREASRYLPPPNEPGRLTWVQALSAVASTNDISGDAHTFSGNTWVARGTDRVYAEWYNTDAKSLSVDQLAWQRDTEDRAYEAGIFRGRADGGLLMQSTLLAGAGIGTSLKLRNDIATQDATRLLVFLDSRSSVAIYRDGRLISSESYDAGNQQLDTSMLPYGAYDIEIRITDAAGTARAINRFFVKSPQLAPQGEPQWFVEGGEALVIDAETTLPDDAGTAMLRGGWSKRLASDLGITLGAAAVDTHALAEGNVTWLHPLLAASGGLMLSTQGDAGWTAASTFRWRELSGSLNARRVWAAEDDPADYQIAGTSSAYRSLSLNYPAFTGQLTLSADHSASLYTESEIYAVRFARHFAPASFPRFLFTSELSNADGDLVLRLALDVSGIGDRWYWRANPGLQHEETDGGPTDDYGTLSAQLGWRDGDRWSEDIEANLRTNLDNDSRILGMDAQYASDYGRLRASIDDVQGGTLDSRYASASYITSFVAGLGSTAYGGRQSASGSLIVDLRSAPPDSEFDLLVDGRKIAVRGGRRVPVLLQPYRTYDIRLVDRGLNFLHYDDVPRQVTLYPGSVVPLVYKVERVVVAFGRVLHKQHACSVIDNACYDIVSPLRNASLTGLAGFSMTDEDGTFQAEMITGTERIHVQRGAVECDLVLPAPRDVNGMLAFGDLTCESSIEPEQLPETPLSIAPSTVAARPPAVAPAPAAAATVIPAPAEPATPAPAPTVAADETAATATLAWNGAAPGTVVATGRLQLQQHVCMALDNTCHDIVLPMRNATVRSAHGETVTGSDGSFRLTIAGDATTLAVSRRDRACTITLPPFVAVDGVAALGDLRCTLEVVPEADAGADATPAVSADDTRLAAAPVAARPRAGRPVTRSVRTAAKPATRARPATKAKPGVKAKPATTARPAAKTKPATTAKPDGKTKPAGRNAVRASRDAAAAPATPPKKPKPKPKPKKTQTGSNAGKGSNAGGSPPAGPTTTVAPPAR